MRNRMCVVIPLMLLSGVAATEVQAQTTGRSSRDGIRLFSGLSVVSLWDDETFLGRGPLVSGGVALPLGRHARVEGEVGWATHHRDSGYLAADGTPIVGTARLAYLFQPPQSRARAFASAGIAIVRSTGHFTTKTILRGAGGFPVEGPSERRDWSLTQQAFELGGGVTIASSERLSFRPEVRWTSTGADPSPFATIEAPIWVLRAGLTVEWRVRRRG